MDESIRNIEGEEARLVMAQFLGSTIGELKEIDKNITNRTNTLQGVNINPMDVINKLTVEKPNHSQPSPPAANYVQVLPVPPQPPTTLTVSPGVSIHETSHPAPTTPQLELNFSYDIMEDIVKKFDSINKRLGSVEKDIATILTYIESKNKKKVDKPLNT